LLGGQSVRCLGGQSSIDNLEVELRPGRHPELIAEWLWHDQAPGRIAGGPHGISVHDRN
jgi:hypothetical protein